MVTSQYFLQSVVKRNARIFLLFVTRKQKDPLHQLRLKEWPFVQVTMTLAGVSENVTKSLKINCYLIAK